MNAFVEIVVSNALLVVILAVIVAVVGRFWKNPAGLHLLWLLVLLKFVTPPLLTISIHLPSRSIAPENDVAARLPDREAALPADEKVADWGTRQTHRALNQVPVADQSLATKSPTRIPWLDILAWLLGIGVMFIASWQAFRIFRLQKMLRDAQPATGDVLSMVAEVGKQLGLRRIPRVRMLPVRVSPMVLSVGFRPQLLLPMELFKRLETTAQRSLLAHELAHVRRKDHLVRLLELLVTTLFWWHPVVWWASRELQRLEDLCCDAMVVALMPESRKIYATALMNTLDFLCDGSLAAPLGVTATQSYGLLTRRIAMLKNRSGVMRLTVGRIVLLVLVAAVPMSIAVAAKSQVDSKVTQPREAEVAAVSQQSASSPQTPASTNTTPPGTHAKSANEAPSAPKPDDEHQHTDFILPGVYSWLQSPAFRKQFNISGDQEQKLREISAKYMAALQPTIRSQEDLGKLPPDKRQAKVNEVYAAVRRTSQNTRQQIEQLLRADQLAAIRHAYISGQATIIAQSLSTSSPLDPQAIAKQYGLSPEQKRQLSELVKEVTRKDEELTRIYEEQVLGVPSREQREKLGAKFTEAETIGPFVFCQNWPVFTGFFAVGGPQHSALLQFVSPMGTTLSVFPELRNEAVQKELGLTDEQKRRLQAVSDKLQTTAQGIVKDYESYIETIQHLPPEEMKAKSAEVQARRAVCQKKLDELGKNIIQQVKAILTPAQVSTHKRRAIREKSFEAIANLKVNPKLGESLGLSQEQQEKLHQLDKELRASLSSVINVGEKALKFLTIPQQKRIEEEWTQMGP